MKERKRGRIKEKGNVTTWNLTIAEEDEGKEVDEGLYSVSKQRGGSQE